MPQKLPPALTAAFIAFAWALHPLVGSQDLAAPDDGQKPTPKQVFDKFRSDYRAAVETAFGDQKASYLRNLEALEIRATAAADSVAAAAIRGERESTDIGVAPLKLPADFASPCAADLITTRKEFAKARETALVTVNTAFADKLQHSEKEFLAAGDPISAATAKTESDALRLPPLKVLRASYGKGRYIDVTATVRRAIVFNRIELLGDNNLGGNPREHMLKQTVIDYQMGDAPAQHVVFAQHTTIKLPRPADIAKDVVKPPATTPALPPAPQHVASNLSTPTPASKVRAIVLARGWDGPCQGGDLTLGDLGSLFYAHGTAGDSIAGDPSIMVFENVPFLTPIEDAKNLLKLSGKLPSKMKVACPGLPRDSFSYYAFDGIFEGHYNRLYLVTDGADQVVSAQLVDETPRSGRVPTDRNGRHTYNFVNYRVKALTTLMIDQKLSQPRKLVQMVDSVLINPGSESRTTTSTSSSVVSTANPVRPRILEQSRWYVPQPIVNLILKCVEQR